MREAEQDRAREIRAICADAQLRQNIPNQFRDSFGSSATPLHLSNVDTQAAIREAVLAERERCAKTAENWLVKRSTVAPGLEIAAEIRKGK